MARRILFRESKEKLVSRFVLVDVRIFYSDRHSHLFNKLEITYIYVIPLSLVTRLLMHTLTQAIIHTHVTLEP